jgi:mono/diheme cytochrome c family protein
VDAEQAQGFRVPGLGGQCLLQQAFGERRLAVADRARGAVQALYHRRRKAGHARVVIGKRSVDGHGLAGRKFTRCYPSGDSTIEAAMETARERASSRRLAEAALRAMMTPCADAVSARRNLMKTLLAFFAGLLLLPLVAAAVVFTGHVASDSLPAPPAWEQRLGNRALDVALEARAEQAAPKFAPLDDATLLLGMKEYREHCAGCHGGARGPSAWGAHDFYPRVPQFWQDNVDVNQAEAYVAIRDGIRYSGMAAQRDQMPDNEIQAMAGFVSHMHSLPPSVDAEWRKAPAAGAPEAAGKD